MVSLLIILPDGTPMGINVSLVEMEKEREKAHGLAKAMGALSIIEVDPSELDKIVMRTKKKKLCKYRGVVGRLAEFLKSLEHLAIFPQGRGRLKNT